CSACRQGESCPARDHEFVGIPSPPATILAHQPLGNRQHRPNPGASTNVQGREPGRAEEPKELSYYASDSRNPAKTGIPLARRSLRPITSKAATTTEDTERENLRGPGLVSFLNSDRKAFVLH